MDKMKAVPVWAFVLAGLAWADMQEGPLQVTGPGFSGELTLPAGYVPSGGSYRRMVAAADWGTLTLELIPSEGLFPQHRGALEGRDEAPRVLADRQEKTSWIRWKEVEIPLVEKWGFGKNPLFQMAASIPLDPNALTVVITGAQVLENDIRTDFQAILGSLQGKTNWLPTEVLRRGGTTSELPPWVIIGAEVLGGVGLLSYCFGVFLSLSRMRHDEKITVLGRWWNPFTAFTYAAMNQDELALSFWCQATPLFIWAVSFLIYKIAL
jgi:hypothetical protein